MKTSGQTQTDLISGTFVKAGLEPGPEHKQLEPLIGRWINEGETIATPGAPSMRIVTSDVFEWVPGGFFVIHYAYGKAGNFDGGAVEIIGYDETSKKYRNYCFDSSGILTQEEGTFVNGKWIFGGKNTRFTGAFTDNGKTIAGKHERLIDGKWTHVMTITLRKVK